MKRILSLLLLLCILLALPFSVGAENPRIVDEAGLLSDGEISDLNETIDYLVERYNMDVVIVTVESLGFQFSQTYADDYYDNNGYGIGPDYSGVLILYCPEYRDCAISTCGKAIAAISDVDIDSIFDDMTDDIRAERYFEAFQTFLSGIETSFLSYEEALEGQERADQKGKIVKVLGALVISAVIAGITLFVMRRQMNTARFQNGASNYVAAGTMDLYRKQDYFLYSNVTKVRRSNDSGSSGGRSGGSSHRSSSGRSHGGGSRRF